MVIAWGSRSEAAINRDCPVLQHVVFAMVPVAVGVNLGANVLFSMLDKMIG
ncbi:hypothetical protein ACF1BQ_030560 [Bradyrhizobium sp. RDT10]